MSKILEKLVNKRLVDFLEKYKLLSNRQFGFRRGKSTEDAVELLTETVSSYLDGRHKCIGVFLDLAKAFDSVSTSILLKKLESFGIRGNTLNWFLSYLTNRSQRVKVDTYNSNEECIEFGVPQGSILAPTLFTIYMDDIFRTKLQNAELICYADDTVAIFHGKDWQTTIKEAEKGMAILARWLDLNLLTLNIKKTNFVAFHITRATQPNMTHLKIHGGDCTMIDPDQISQSVCSCSVIERVEAAKYLGIVVDQNLSFKKHIALVSRKVRKIIYLMQKLRPIAKPEVRKLVYTSLCQSIIQYCIRAWGGAAKTHMLELERAQRAVLKVMLGKPRRYPTDKLYQEAAVLRVRQLCIMRIISKVHSHTDHLHEPRKRARKPTKQLPNANTTFYSRHPKYLHIYTYNAVCKSISMKNITFAEAKSKLKRWLLSLSYEDSERLVKADCF